jgi:hypothetical protein
MVSQSEVRRLLGNLDDDRVAAILKLAPSLREVEVAAACLDGRTEMLRKGGQHLSSTAADILGIVLSDEAVVGGS